MLTHHLAEVKDVSVVVSMMEEFYAIDGYAFDVTSSMSNLQSFLQHPEWGRIWLLHYQETYIGYIALTFGYSFEFGGPYAWIDEFFIVESQRKKGFGKQTLSFVLEQAKQLGLASLQLEVEVSNKIGRKLYEIAGFKVTGRELMVKKV